MSDNEIDMSAKARRERAKERAASDGAQEVPQSFYNLIDDIVADLDSPPVESLFANIKALEAEAVKYAPALSTHAKAFNVGIQGVIPALSKIKRPPEKTDELPDYDPANQ